MFNPALGDWNVFKLQPMKRLKDGLTYIAHKIEEDEVSGFIERQVYMVLSKVFKSE